MLFNILFIILLIYALIAPYLFIKFGMKIAEKGDKKSEIPMFDVKFDNFTKKKPEMTRRDRQEIQKWANLMRYDGTSSGQVKISEVK